MTGVPFVPPRPVFAAVVFARTLLLRLWRRLAPPEITLFESIINGLTVVHSARAACALGLPEQLRDGPRTADELAGASGTQPLLLARFLRTLASHEILVEHRDGRFALAPLGRALLPNRPGSMRGAALFLGSPWLQRSWLALPDTLRTGRTGMDLTFGMDAWTYLSAHPEERRHFQDGMVDITSTDAPAFARAVDFAGAKRVCDVGGGYGTLLAHVLAQHPHLEGVLFDHPGVLEEARPMLESWGVAGRVQLVGGDFFAAVPGGCDVYLLRQVLHDWDDARAEQILRAVRAAMAPGQRVLVYEMQRGQQVSPHPAFTLDLMMMVATPHGRERSVAELQALLVRSGFQPGRLTPLAAPLAVLEGIAV